METGVFKKLIIASLLALLMPLTSCSQTRILNDLPTGEGIDKVFVGKTMLSFAGNMGNIARGAGDFLKEIESIEVYDCSKAALVPSIKKEFDKILKKHKAELLLTDEDNNNESSIYILYSNGKDSEPTGMAIVDNNQFQIDIVILNGKIDLKKLSGFMKNQ